MLRPRAKIARGLKFFMRIELYIFFSIAKKVGHRLKRHSHLVPHGATVQGGAYALVFEAEF